MLTVDWDGGHGSWKILLACDSLGVRVYQTCNYDGAFALAGMGRKNGGPGCAQILTVWTQNKFERCVVSITQLTLGDSEQL